MSTDEPPFNPWRLLLEDCIRGEEHLRPDDYRALLKALDEGCAAIDRIASLEAELAAVRVNAERYKTWRESYAEDANSAEHLGLMLQLADAWTEQQIDDAIDAARATKGAA